jgi:hypothetical protein
LVLMIAALITSLLPSPQLWAAIDRTFTVAGNPVSLAKLLHILIGYTLFIYGSFVTTQRVEQQNRAETECQAKRASKQQAP